MPRATVDLGTGTIRFADYDPAGLASQIARAGEAWAGAAGQLGQIRMQDRRDAAARDAQLAGAGVYDGPDEGMLRMSRSVSGLRDQASLAQDQAEFHQMRGQFDAAAQREAALQQKLAAQGALQQRREAARAERGKIALDDIYDTQTTATEGSDPTGSAVKQTTSAKVLNRDRALQAYQAAVAGGDLARARAIYERALNVQGMDALAGVERPWETQEAAEDAQVGGIDAARELALLRAQRDALLQYRGARSGKDARYFLGSGYDRYAGLFPDAAPAAAAPAEAVPLTMGGADSTGVIQIDDSDQGTMAPLNAPAAQDPADPDAPPMIPNRDDSDVPFTAVDVNRPDVDAADALALQKLGVLARLQSVYDNADNINRERAGNPALPFLPGRPTAAGFGLRMSGEPDLQRHADAVHGIARGQNVDPARAQAALAGVMHLLPPSLRDDVSSALADYASGVNRNPRVLSQLLAAAAAAAQPRRRLTQPPQP